MTSANQETPVVL